MSINLVNDIEKLRAAVKLHRRRVLRMLVRTENLEAEIKRSRTEQAQSNTLVAERQNTEKQR